MLHHSYFLAVMALFPEREEKNKKNNIICCNRNKLLRPFSRLNNLFRSQHIIWRKFQSKHLLRRFFLFRWNKRWNKRWNIWWNKRWNKRRSIFPDVTVLEVLQLFSCCELRVASCGAELAAVLLCCCGRRISFSLLTIPGHTEHGTQNTVRNNKVRCT